MTRVQSLRNCFLIFDRKCSGTRFVDPMWIHCGSPAYRHSDLIISNEDKTVTVFFDENELSNRN